MVMPNLIPFQNKWLVSYETLLFDTLDGDLDITQYALDGNGKGYYVRTVPKNQGHFQWVDLKYDVSKLTQVKIIAGHAYYDEHLTAVGAFAIAAKVVVLPAGSIIRVPSTAAKYNPLKTVKDHPQPSRIEMVSVLPPPLPDNLPAKHHSIGFDATSNSGALGAVSSYSWNHTCGVTANLLVFGDSLFGNGINITVTAVTYNGAALTYIRSDQNVTTTRSTIYFMYAPTTGFHTVSVTYSETVFCGVGGVVSYSGARQSGQPDANNGGTGNSDTASVAVVTVADNCWVFSVVLMRNTTTCGNTQRWNVPGCAPNYIGGGSDTNAPVTPPGSQTMSWTQSANTWAISAASFAPSPKSGGSSIASKLIAAGLI